MRFVTRCSLLLVFVVSTTTAAASTLPSLTAQDDNGAVALSVESLHISVMIRGHLARTTYELTYRSTLDRDVDGDFSFPLPPDAEVSDIALYFGTVLRHAVPVERVQARTAYEETIHRRADPALAEWSTTSRAFHFRVFPIPAHGTKLVHISYDQELTIAPYELDLRYGTSIHDFELVIDGDAHVDGGALPLRATGSGWSVRQQDAKLDAVVRATTDDDERAFAVWSASDKVWYASARLHLRSTARPVDPAQHVTVLYDASGSAVQRDAAKLRDFLAAFLALQAPGARVNVVPFHLALDTVRDTDAPGLERTLAAIPLAGATNLAAALDAIRTIRPDSRVVLITDGVNDIGDSAHTGQAVTAIGRLRRPLTIVNASPTSDDHLLGALARASGGWFVDLVHADPTEAAASVMRLPLRVEYQAGHPSIRDFRPAAVLVTSDVVTVVSARSRDSFTILPVIAGNARHDVPVHVLESDDELDLVRRAWARAQLRTLLDSGAPPEIVHAHGRRFSQLTPQTSLLVLETWQDYVNWKIPLPADLRAQRAAEEEEEAREAARNNEPSRITMRGVTDEVPPERAVWFLTGTARLDDNPLPGVTIMLTPAGEQPAFAVTNADGRYWIRLAQVPRSFTLSAELESLNRAYLTFPHGAPNGSVADIAMKLESVAEAITVTASAPNVPSETTGITEGRNTSLAHRDAAALADRLLSALASDEPVIADEQAAARKIDERLERIGAVVAKLRSLTSLDDRFRYYAAARSVLGGEKLFQAEAALAVRDDAPDLAVRLVTDLIEAYPDDAPTLRLIGRVLAAWGRNDLAALLFERAIELSPRESQSWRELILLRAMEGRDAELADLQRRHERYTRDERMYQTENALDEELKRRRPGTDARIDPNAELQVEAMWDSNYTDIDLHVIEPGGEEVYYGHRDSANGGRLHDDVINGYGPEIYTIPHVQPGQYQIVLETYAEDVTRVTQETLAHIIVWTRGERRDLFVALAPRKDRRVVAVVTSASLPTSPDTSPTRP